MGDWARRQIDEGRNARDIADNLPRSYDAPSMGHLVISQQELWQLGTALSMALDACERGMNTVYELEAATGDYRYPQKIG